MYFSQAFGRLNGTKALVSPSNLCVESDPLDTYQLCEDRQRYAHVQLIPLGMYTHNTTRLCVGETIQVGI